MDAIKFNIDTWLKTSTAQGSALPDDQRQFIEARTVLPLAAYSDAGNNHYKITLGTNAQGQQIFYKGRNTWYVYQPAVEIFRVATVDPYSILVTANTWFKQSVAQASTLADSQKVYIESGSTFPIAAFAFEQNHVKFTLGKDQVGQQVFLKGRNTWYAYEPHVDVLRNDVPLFDYGLKFKTDTWLKQSTAQAASLSDSQKQFIAGGTILPLAAFEPQFLHLKVTFGQNAQGEQVEFNGRNTWYVYEPTVEVLHNDQSFDATTSINAKGLRLIKAFEGLRLTAYRDPVGIWTIGYGTTRGVYPGMQITEAQAEQLLRNDVQRFEAAVRQLVTVPLDTDEFSALVSFTYNVGEGAFANSTLLRKLNQGDREGASNEFLRWVNAGGRVLPGLERRRKAERALFRGEDFTVFL